MIDCGFYFSIMIKKICVFAASSPGISDEYLEASREMARILVSKDITMSYGAGSVGIMGAMADVMLENKGKVIGVIPEFMKDMGWAHPHLDEMILVETMHERKNLMIEGVDAVIAMPGGVGTLEELLEVITLKQLGKFLKPIIILNTNNFYDPLLQHLKLMVDENFMRPLHENIWKVTDEPSEVLKLIKEEPEWDASAIKYAAVEANVGRVRTSGQ
jgi:uncharacterized protein (TIGR00730 family)